MARIRRIYGARGIHLVVLVAAFALVAYTVSVVGVKNLFNPQVWWQSIAVWFAVAVIAHDLILFPLYALADRLLTAARSPRRQQASSGRREARPRLTNYLRLPTLASGLLLLMFFPGIIEQGGQAYRNATGLTQEPFLHRWLAIAAVLYLIAALWFTVRTIVGRRHRDGTSASTSSTHPSPALEGQE